MDVPEQQVFPKLLGFGTVWEWDANMKNMLMEGTICMRFCLSPLHIVRLLSFEAIVHLATFPCGPKLPKSSLMPLESIRWSLARLC